MILKDVLGSTLEEIVESTGASLPAVKAALHRGRAALRARSRAHDRERSRQGPGGAGGGARAPAPVRGAVQRARLGGAAPVHRRGLPARSRVAHRAARPRGRRVLRALRGKPATSASSPACSTTAWPGAGPALAVHAPSRERAAEHLRAAAMAGGRVALIRDFRYVPYIAAEVALGRRDVPGRSQPTGRAHEQGQRSRDRRRAVGAEDAAGDLRLPGLSRRRGRSAGAGGAGRQDAAPLSPALHRGPSGHAEEEGRLDAPGQRRRAEAGRAGHGRGLGALRQPTR